MMEVHQFRGIESVVTRIWQGLKALVMAKALGVVGDSCGV